MKRLFTICATLWLAAGIVRAADATVRELLAAVAAQPSDAANWLLIPIAGSTVGRDGTVFHTELAIAASPDFYDDARVAVAWLPVGRDASEDPVRYLTIPSEFDASFTLYRDGLGSPGFGALVAAVVDANGALVPLGEIEGEIRVWSQSRCSGEASFAYHAGRAVGVDVGSLAGLTLADGYRSNVGIVNAGAVPRTWRIRYGTLDGGSPSDLSITVPAASSTIVGLDAVTPGPIAVEIESESAGVSWTAWGASVDNASGDAWLSPIAPFRVGLGSP